MLSEAATSLPSRSTTRSWVALPSLATWISYAPAARLSLSRAMLKSASVAVIDVDSCGPDDADSCGPDDAAAEVGPASASWLDDAAAESDVWVDWAPVSSDPPPQALTDRASRTAAPPVVRLRWVNRFSSRSAASGAGRPRSTDTATFQYPAEALPARSSAESGDLPTPPDHGLQHLAVHRFAQFLPIGAHGRMPRHGAQRVPEIGDPERHGASGHGRPDHVEIRGVHLQVLLAGQGQHRDADAAEVLARVVGHELAVPPGVGPDAADPGDVGRRGVRRDGCRPRRRPDGAHGQSARRRPSASPGHHGAPARRLT